MEYRRHLPHFHPEGRYLFVTWRLYGSLPKKQPEILQATPGHAFAAADRTLAGNRENCWLEDKRVAACVAETIRTGQMQGIYGLIAWVIMPNMCMCSCCRTHLFRKSRTGSRGVQLESAT